MIGLPIASLSIISGAVTIPFCSSAPDLEGLEADGFSESSIGINLSNFLINQFNFFE
jgi:hypothetical protein